ncbi:MAG TPA: GspE/PulE family protein [Candidatus Eisenbacteria bacterium]|nr:GspE/PulE family protein [Candidatus Eisenbacteria bacterium]
MKNISERIIEALKKSNRISEADIQKALAVYAKEGGGKLADVLVRMELISENELISILGDELNMPFLNLAKYKLDPDLGQMVPEKLARKYQIVPISKMGKTLTLAVRDPFNILAIDDIAAFTKHKVDCVISTEKEIKNALDRLYTPQDAGQEAPAEAPAAPGAPRPKVVLDDSDDQGSFTLGAEEASDAPIVKIVDALLRDAMKKRASDIHIEPFEKEARVRLRIDGCLEEQPPIPKASQNAVLTRLKIMSRINITENRIPQDGRFKIKMQNNKEVDFRVSILPVSHGSKVVMRILDKTSLSLGLEKLGFLPDTLGVMKEGIAAPFGMILITGPTGSGKSTTLYSILNQLNTPEKNIITIEDPIEYQVKGITQIQARSEIGFDFASGLRAILRQSPDIVMVGEIRDGETADIAVKASLTGQVVLSTLHTNDAPGAMSRLIDMKVEPFLIASSVVLVAAQRLARKICGHCKEKSPVPAEVFERLKIDVGKYFPGGQEHVFYKGKGCIYCNKTGYSGRMAILELLLIDDPIRDLIMKRASAHLIKEHAVQRGMITLREDAIRKFCAGMTTLDEILRVTAEE